ncbi:hypothetical protein ACOSP7_031495 [Xanthoceras sorbifolium]
MGPPPQKINLISYGPLAHISDIKLIRTDTTLDLSQKAEKGTIDLQMTLRYLCRSKCGQNGSVHAWLMIGHVQAPSAGPRVPKANKIKKSRGCRTRVKITSFLHTFWPLAHISNIKLIRTNTTLDLSQKAEKGFKNHNEFNNFS